MYAIIRDSSEKHYTSTVFGYFCKITPWGTADTHSGYYLVLNPEKNRLIKKFVFPKEMKYLDPQILIVDADQENWIVDEDGRGCVDFLEEICQETIETELSAGLLQKCIELDAAYIYQEYPEIRSERDIQNLLRASGWFHDAYIVKCEQQKDAVYVLFEGTWGCSIEIWFEGDASCCTKSRDPETADPYWFDANIFFEGGFYYLVDSDQAQIQDITDGFCWFRARRMRWHVIPD